MNWENEIKERLYKYPKRKCAIANLKERILYLEDAMTAVKPVTMDKVPLRDGGTKHEDVMINNMMELADLKINLRFCEREVAEIDKALKILTDTEYRVIELFYLTLYRTSIQRISEELTYEKSQVYNIRNAAIKKLTIYLYGREYTH